MASSSSLMERGILISYCIVPPALRESFCWAGVAVGVFMDARFLCINQDFFFLYYSTISLYFFSPSTFFLKKLSLARSLAPLLFD